MPYSQERYFENHKLMAVMDKLHKLYSSTAQPIVWARSLGLEVLNEFDTVKAAIMMSAGANPVASSTVSLSESQRASLFNLAASGVESAVATANTASLVRDGLGAIVGRGLQGLLQNASGVVGKK